MGTKITNSVAFNSLKHVMFQIYTEILELNMKSYYHQGFFQAGRSDVSGTN